MTLTLNKWIHVDTCPKSVSTPVCFHSDLGPATKEKRGSIAKSDHISLIP
jgi:hypothetical protein